MFEAVGHAKAYDFIFSVFQGRRIDEQTVLKIHELFYQNIEPEYTGRYRDVRVLITGLRYPVAARRRYKRRWISCLRFHSPGRGRRRKGWDSPSHDSKT